jgi:hypothetical protein
MFLDSLGKDADCLAVVFLAQVSYPLFSAIASSSSVSMRVGDRKSILRGIWLFLGDERLPGCH